VTRRNLVLALVLVALVASGCSKKKDDRLKVVDFVDATTPHSFRLDYQVEERGVDVQVRGIVEDDFRYKLQLDLDGKTAAEQVVVDDAVALRFFDSSLVTGYTDPAVRGQVKTDTDVPGASVFDALNAGRWVLDPAGAPSPILQSAALGDDIDTPRDPLFDARTALGYVRRVAESSPFRRYDPETINPTYRKDEDPFPVPEEGSGVTRFDAVILPLPAPAQATSGNRVLPSELNFRKMAVYVKGGLVIAVREFIGVSPRQLDQLREYEEALIEATANDDVVAGFRDRVASFRDDHDALAQFLVDGLNTFISSTGATPLRFRTMSLEIADVDKVTTTVQLPGDVVKADLAVLRGFGRKPVAADATPGG
jgi:hypothetical protein